MAETNYEKYIITDLNKVPDELGTRVYCLNGDVFEGAPYIDCAWFWPQSREVVVVDKGHCHDFKEVVTFFGSNPDDPTDLCGEIEFGLGDKTHRITKSCIIFVPAGVKHCPLIIKKLDRPVFHSLWPKQIRADIRKNCRKNKTYVQEYTDIEHDGCI